MCAPTAGASTFTRPPGAGIDRERPRERRRARPDRGAQGQGRVPGGADVGQLAAPTSTSEPRPAAVDRNQRRAGQAQGREQVLVHEGAPLVVAGGTQEILAAAHGPGRVHHPVQPAEPRDRGGDDRLRRAVRRQIGGMNAHAPLRGFHRPARAGPPRAVRRRRHGRPPGRSAGRSRGRSLTTRRSRRRHDPRAWSRRESIRAAARLAPAPLSSPHVSPFDPRDVDSTPFGAPLVPVLPIRLRRTEILTVVYRTDRDAADALVPAPLRARRRPLRRPRLPHARCRVVRRLLRVGVPAAGRAARRGRGGLLAVPRARVRRRGGGRPRALRPAEEARTGVARARRRPARRARRRNGIDVATATTVWKQRPAAGGELEQLVPGRP